MMSGRSSGYPFTASQWQELEQQTLIYKYMTSGMPIPSELLQHMRRSYFLDSTITTTPPALAFAPQPSPMGWGYGYQMGFGCRKAEDPEPGRCRRTDGKKWRCSKEAYPDSKYCERHMHRGKNRSRKPVEMSLTTNSPAAAASLSISQPEAYHHLLYPYPPSSSRPPGTTSFHLDNDKDYRYYHGVKDVDQYSILSEASRGTERVSSWEFRPLGMSSLGETRQNFTRVEEEREKKQQQHCFVLGADFNNKEKPLREETEEEDASHRPLRHFFDESPQKSKDSWIDLEGGGRSNQAAASYSKTQLSIAIPMSYHDTTPQYHNDD